MSTDVAMLRALGRRASRAADAAGIRVYAGCIAYRSIFSLIAFASTLMLIFQTIDVPFRGDSSLRALDRVPHDVRDVLIGRLDQAQQIAGSHAAIAGFIGLMLGVFGMAGGFAALTEVLDRIHGVHEYRRQWQRYLRGGAIALVSVSLTTVALIALAAGTSLGEDIFQALGLDWAGRVTMTLVRIALAIISITGAFVFLMRWGSHARPPWQDVVASAIVATTGWLLLVMGFFGTVALLQPFSVYGALASAISLLMFCYLQAYIMLTSAMFAPSLSSLAASLMGHGSFTPRIAADRTTSTSGAS